MNKVLALNEVYLVASLAFSAASTADNVAAAEKGMDVAVRIFVVDVDQARTLLRPYRTSKPIAKLLNGAIARDSVAIAILHPAGRRFARWWRAFTDWRVRRMAISQLALMSDHELKDIGLIRDQIEVGVRGDLARDTTIVSRDEGGVQAASLKD